MAKYGWWRLKSDSIEQKRQWVEYNEQFNKKDNDIMGMEALTFISEVISNGFLLFICIQLKPSGQGGSNFVYYLFLAWLNKQG